MMAMMAMMAATAGPDARMAGRPAARRVALVHHWLVSRRGGERVLASLAGLVPGATLFTLVHDQAIAAPAGIARVVTSPLQHLPAAPRTFRALLPLHPAAWRSLDLSGHDLVLSSDAALAKTVRVPPGVPHVCYCYSPPRWAWDLSELYLRESVPAAARPLVRAVLARTRAADRRGAEGVMRFVAISEHVRQRIARCYGRVSVVVHPPVDTDFFTPGGATPAGARSDEPAPGVGAPDHDPTARPYLLLGEAVAYKRFEVAIAACRALDRPLVVAGGGRALVSLRTLAGPRTRFVPDPDDAAVRALYRGCRALLFPGEDDFGLVPVEAQACGRPVIALGRGGALETVVDGSTGCLYLPGDGEADVAALVQAMRRFERGLEPSFDPAVARSSAERFSIARFRTGLSTVLATA